MASAIQVCASLHDVNTKQREINGLIEALSTYNLERGLIITEDEHGLEQHEYKGKMHTIEIVPCWKWLLYYNARH